MSEELHKLQRIGAQKIYEKTHIPIQHIQEILQGNFSGLSRIQFLGFLSIIEREYSEDLSQHRAFGISYFDEIDKEDSSSLSISPEEKKSKKSLYLGVAILIFVVVLVLKYVVYTPEVQEKKVDNTLIENVQKNIEPKIALLEEVNQTQESNSSIKIPLEQKEPEVKEVKSFKIITKSKVWFGYIDILTNKKRDKIFKGEFDLDPNKEWLLLFGHGYIDMYINGKIIKFSSRNNVRFEYKDGEIHAINKSEFKKLNRGRLW